MLAALAHGLDVIEFLARERKPALLGAVAAGGAKILSVQRIRQSLEDYFLEQMGLPSGGEGPGRERWELPD